MSPMSPRTLRPTASGFNPKSIAGLALWLDAQDGSTMFDADTGGSPVAADAGVGRWLDKSGTSRHVVQSVANNRPLLTTGIVNGRSVLRFDGSNDILIPESAGSDLAFPYSLFVVYQSSDAAGTIVGLNRVTGSFIGEGCRKSAASTLQGLQQNGASTAEATVTAASADFHVAELVFSGTSASLTYTVRANGGPTGNMTVARARDDSAQVRRLEIGGAFIAASAADLFAGDIAEVLAYGRTLSASELSRVRQYLGSRYGITVTP
jgi:hypothetical protein